VVPQYKQALSSVAGMHQFLGSMEGTPGAACWAFWVFVDRYRNCTSPYQMSVLLRRVPFLFLDDTARSPLPQSIRKVCLVFFSSSRRYRLPICRSSRYQRRVGCLSPESSRRHRAPC
jgi:hypothetical protein